ncbi:putative two-component regulator sensor kinase [unidentified eubacterium SCB49]|nr:putative two-component regulator sensor kinase [unidentified eubacterium SCB49]
MTNYLQLLLCFFCFTFITETGAQQKQIDSIENILSLVKDIKQREVKLDSIINNDLEYGDSEVRIYFINKAIAQSKKASNDRRLSDIYVEKSRWFDSQMIQDSSMYYGKESLRVATITNDSTAILNSWRNLANVYRTNGDYTTALKYYNLTLDYCDKNGISNSRDALLTKFNLATLYYEMDDFERSKTFYNELLNHPLIVEDTDWYNETRINYTMLLFVTEEYDQMLSLAKDLEKSETRPGFLTYIYSMISGANLGLKNLKEALYYNDKAIKQFEKVGDSLNAWNNMFMSGDIRVDMGDYDEAERIYKYVEAKIEGNPEAPAVMIENVALALSKVYRSKGDYKRALEYNDKRHAFKDSLKGIEKQKAISELEIKYETERTKREKQIAEKQVTISQLESKKNKNLFIGSLIIIVLVGIAALLLFGRIKARKKAEIIRLELQEAQKRLALEKQYRESELKALKAQMNPHFIFNALNSIQEYIILNKKNLAGDYLGKFADLMRKYLQQSDTGTLSIHDEIEGLEMYLNLEALRFEDKLTYSFNVSETINIESLYIPTMLIQPYVENALKHGLLHRKTDRKLWVSFTKVAENTITCCIEDNGVGRAKAGEIKAQNKKLHTSFATKATESRLELLNYKKDQKVSIEIIDLFEEDGSVKGTRVVLNIPIVKDEKRLGNYSST